MRDLTLKLSVLTVREAVLGSLFKLSRTVTFSFPAVRSSTVTHSEAPAERAYSQVTPEAVTVSS